MYLVKLYREWKILFYLVVLAISAQAYFIYKEIENTPFFLYHMFSTPHAAKDSIDVNLIKTSNGFLNTTNLSGRERELLLNNVEYYRMLKQQEYKDPIISTVNHRFKKRVGDNLYQQLQMNLSNDSLHIIAYPAWWKRYFVQVNPKLYDSLSVVTSHMFFRQGKVRKSNADAVIFTIHQK